MAGSQSSAVGLITRSPAQPVGGAAGAGPQLAGRGVPPPRAAPAGGGGGGTRLNARRPLSPRSPPGVEPFLGQLPLPLGFGAPAFRARPPRVAPRGGSTAGSGRGPA